MTSTVGTTRTTWPSGCQCRAFAGQSRTKRSRAGPKHLACYELESPTVLESDAYRRLQANPTPWTKRASPEHIGTTFIRNVYTMIHPAGLTPEIARSPMA